jgi:NADH-ubiquinone oxidoreductase chain 4
MILADASNQFAPIVQILALVSVLYASFASILQLTMKALVMYSSIPHMAVVIIRLFNNTILGITGALVLPLPMVWSPQICERLEDILTGS